MRGNRLCSELADQTIRIDETGQFPDTNEPNIPVNNTLGTIILGACE